MISIIQEYLINNYLYIQLFPVLIGCFFLSKLKKEYKLFFWLLVYSVLNELFKQYYGNYIDIGRNRILTNIYNAIYFIFLFWLFYKTSKNNSFKIFIKFIVTLYFASIFYEVFIENLNYHIQTQVIPYIVGGTGILICVFKYFFNILNSKEIINIYNDLLFWIAIAHFIYYLAFTPFKIQENYFSGINKFEYLFSFKIGVTLLKSIFLSLGFIWNTQKKVVS